MKREATKTQQTKQGKSTCKPTTGIKNMEQSEQEESPCPHVCVCLPMCVLIVFIGIPGVWTVVEGLLTICLFQLCFNV